MVIFIDTERNLVICRDWLLSLEWLVLPFSSFFLVTSVNSFSSFVYYC